MAGTTLRIENLTTSRRGTLYLFTPPDHTIREYEHARKTTASSFIWNPQVSQLTAGDHQNLLNFNDGLVAADPSSARCFWRRAYFEWVE